jgi:hypothetical protein
MMRDRIGETLTRHDRSSDLRDGWAQASDIRFAGEQSERIIDARARLQQKGEVAGKDGDVLGARAREEREIAEA